MLQIMICSVILWDIHWVFWIHLFFIKNTPESKKKKILRNTKEYCTIIPLCSCMYKYLAVSLQ